MTEIKTKILRHGKNLPLPCYETRHSAGVDLRAAIEKDLVVRPFERILVPTGIAIALPEDTEAQLRPRSGLAVNFGITLLNSPGTVDADYRGEIKVCLVNLGQQIFRMKRGDRIVQMVIAKVSQVKFVDVKELPETKRGESGFGSTGIA
ncbi:MAG: dUTP diphosphatase [Rickettsiaceae bacterium H1]|nr:dUTP diphosphatase [Rickettsiaceae bacterium H1]